MSKPEDDTTVVRTPKLSHAAPWRVEYVAGGGYDTLSSAYKVFDASGERVCEVDTRDYDDRVEQEATDANPYPYGEETSVEAERIAHLIAAAPDYWYAAEMMSTDAGELEGDDAGYVAVTKESYDALMAAHRKANAKSEGR